MLSFFLCFFRYYKVGGFLLFGGCVFYGCFEFLFVVLCLCGFYCGCWYFCYIVSLGLRCFVLNYVVWFAWVCFVVEWFGLGVLFV